MTILSPQAIATIVAVGLALLRLIPRLQPLVTLYLPPAWRTAPALTVAVIGMVVGVAQAGSDVTAITTALELGLGAIVAIFAPGALPAGAKHAAIFLLVGTSAFATTGCAGRLDDFRPKSSGLTVAGVALEQPGSPRCQQLDSRQLGLGISGYAATGVGAALGAGELVPKESTELRVGLAIGAITATAAGGGLLWGRQATVDEWVQEGCGR
jgi:hypothetical protein